ncbi:MULTISPECIES: DUF2164 domain-containing protein [Bacillota]|uniref:DUF2164 domain-containing protein n=1 Tax=Bacillota TaxID=1239 RepID=UPI001F283804|nr:MULTISPECIES: DUF2164 domain-containing protein [Bacillota]MCF6461997.1 DUF2164 domain-containing protein [Clostridium sp. Cult1]HSH34967.1 DUF2164 domain-containing protein [Schnuerera sp.]
MNKRIELSKDKKDYMIGAIKEYFINEREEDLGDLAAALILDFFMEKLGPEIYNQAIQDAYMFVNEKIQDLFEIEKHY